MRTLYSKISSTSGGGVGGRGVLSAAARVEILQASTCDRPVTTAEVMKGMLSSLRVNSSGHGGSQHQQRVTGLCVISGALLGVPPCTITASDAGVERSPQRSVALLRPQLLSNRKQQPQRTDNKDSEVKGHRAKGEFAAFIEPSKLSSLLPFRAAIDATADRSMSNGSGNSTRSSPSTDVQQRLNSSADGGDECCVVVTEASTPFSHKRHQSLSAGHHQFQTIASRLQLAAVRPSPEMSLLVRLA